MKAVSCSDDPIGTNGMGTYGDRAKDKNLGFEVFLGAEVQALKDGAHQVEENSK